MADNDKPDQKPLVDIKKLDPLGSLTAEQHVEADKRAQQKNDAEDADFTEQINLFNKKKQEESR